MVKAPLRKYRLKLFSDDFFTSSIPKRRILVPNFVRFNFFTQSFEFIWRWSVRYWR